MAYYFHCPSCKCSRSFSIPNEQGTSAPLVLFLFGQWLAALLILRVSRGRVQCGDCGYIFRQPPLPSSPVAKLAKWIGFVMALGAITMIFAMMVSVDSSGFPDVRPIVYFESIISTHLRLFTFVVVIVSVLIVASCIVASLFSNRRFRRDYPDRLKVEAKVTESTKPLESSREDETL